jgi:hypothetical protein
VDGSREVPLEGPHHLAHLIDRNGWCATYMTHYFLWLRYRGECLLGGIGADGRFAAVDRAGVVRLEARIVERGEGVWDFYEEQRR